MVKPTEFVVSLRQVDKDDTNVVGGKGANLGEMIQAGFPVPPGFVITANSYFTFLKRNQLTDKIGHLLGTINFASTDSLNQVARHIRKIIVESPVPQDVVHSVFSSYSHLGENPLVAIRSSATSEDSKEASFAGQNETFLNIKGEAALVAKVREAWASLFEARSVYYRNEKKIDHLKNGIALVVQKMVESECSGVMFTVDPVTNRKDRIVIESIYGLGEYIVQGRVNPDHYEVSKTNFHILKKTRSDQKVMLVKASVENKEVKVPLLWQIRQKIKDSEIIKLAEIGAKIEKHYYFPQDIEWAKEDGKLYIVQTRPITTLENKDSDQKKEVGKTPFTKSTHPILIGDPASPGIGIGCVKILESPKQIGKINPGDILVAPYTNPDYVPAMKKSKAIITEQGGRTSHAAIVSREFGIPAVVGVPNATKILKDGQTVTVNGKTGEIFSGSIAIEQKNDHIDSTRFKTATKIYVNLAEPELADKISLENVDGIGLLRAEFMIAEIGTHPKKMIADKKEKIFIEKLAGGLETICAAFYPRPVIYRATDFKSNEYRNLSGGKDYEPVEPNPMLGYRGAFRYVHDPKVFKLELEAIKFVREKKGLNNLNLMIPFVRTIRELEAVKNIVSVHLKRSHTFKLFMMAEIPSNVILIEEFIKAGIDGVSIGSNDLTMLVLGTDRDNQEVASEFDERNEAVLWALERVIKTCHKHGIPVSICGQAPSVYPTLVEKLVEWGITSVSVSPDAIDTTRKIVYRAEKKILEK